MKVFSFCLYGSNIKYTIGMIENIIIINEKFPDWTIFIYYNNVPDYIIHKINSYKNIKLIKSKYNGAFTMLDRFLPIDNEDVEIMFVRDADSRIHERDIWAINQFINSDKLFHIIRDHKYHTAYILGGLWGIKQNTLGFKLGPQIDKFLINKENKMQADQYFLATIYNKVKDNSLIHGCIKMTPIENIIQFPFPVKDLDFCGQVIDYKNGKKYRVYDLNGFAK